MMSTLALTKALASLFVPIGMVGTGIAVICAVLVAYAIARGAAGLAGGGAGLWIVGALLSLLASFATQWMPFIIAAAALGAALVVGLVARGIVSRMRVSASEQTEGIAVVAASAAEPAAAPASRGRSSESVAVA